MEQEKHTTSNWMDIYPSAIPHTPDGPLSTDVCVVGAGIAGITTAYLLLKEGKKVVVLADTTVGFGETSRTTAHLAWALDDRFFNLERLHGKEHARLAIESHQAAIDCIEDTVSREHIDCDFARVDGYLFNGSGVEDDILEKEMRAAHQLGFREVLAISRAPVDSFHTGPCLRFPRQGQFHPMKYITRLARVILEMGGRIFDGTHVEGVQEGKPAEVSIRNGPKITARDVVITTNAPVNDRFKIHSKQAPYRTYAIAIRIPEVAFPKILLWDTLDPYHYVRSQKDEKGTLLIVGGEDHKTGQDHHPALHWSRLESWTRKRFPDAGEILHRWSGQVMEPVDGLAFIGKNPNDQHIYIATGDSGHGMTHGTIAGNLIRDLIIGRRNPWEKVYEPSRKNLHATAEYSRENLNVMKQYGDYLSPGGDPDQIQPHSGKVIRHGLRKVAVYCDGAGCRHEMSAVCPHLGCLVSWNDAEKTWDCPCHGSRFEATGEVLCGPAVTGLSPLEKAETEKQVEGAGKQG